MKCRLLLLAASCLAAVACSNSDDAPSGAIDESDAAAVASSCTLTLGGATSATTTNCSFSSNTDGTTLYFVGAGAVGSESDPTGYQVSFQASIAGTAPSAGTFAQTAFTGDETTITTGDSTGANPAAPFMSWTQNHGNGSADTGSFTFVISSVGASSSDGFGDTSWTAMHGTFDATVPSDSGGTSLTVHAVY